MARKGLEDPPNRFRGPPKTAKAAARLPFGRKPGPKKPVNITVDAELLKLAKEMGINVSQAAEDALRKLTEEERVRRFREKNRPFFESYNAYIERNGIFGEELREYEDDPPV